MGQPVCIGSDGFFDLPQEADLAKILQITAQGNPSAFSDQMAVAMLYDHNIRLAESTFGCRLGKIAPGYTADLVMIDYHPIAPLEKENLSSHIMGALTGGVVKSVVINGKLVMENAQILTLDEEKIHSDARSAAKNIWERF